MDENDTLGTAPPTRPAPHPAPAGPSDGVHGVPRGHNYPGDLRYAELDRLARLLRRVRVWDHIRPRIIRIDGHGFICFSRFACFSRADEHALADHEQRIAGGDLGNRDTDADDRATVNGGANPNMPAAGPERPRPGVLDSDYDAITPVVTQFDPHDLRQSTPTYLRYERRRRMSDGKAR